MDMKSQIKEKANELIRESSFIEKSPRFAKFILDVCEFVDSEGRIPSAAILSKHLKMKTRSVNYHREMLRERGLWPFPKLAYHRNSSRYERIREFNPIESDPRHKEDMARVAAARKAKLAKSGETLNNEDIEAHL
jgi:hypothetical protein